MEISHIEAAERLSYLIDAKYIRVDRIVTVAGDYGDGDRTEYRVSLQAWNAWVDVPYTVGSGVAFLDFNRENRDAFRPGFGVRPDRDGWATRYPWDKSVDAVAIRKRIREAYHPAVLAVVSAVLSDIASADGCADWPEWATEMGVEFRTADEIRKSQQAHALIVSAFRPWAVRAFGADLPNAIELAGAL
jgi:hypothetical protein